MDINGSNKIPYGIMAENTMFTLLWHLRPRRSFLTGMIIRDFYPGHPYWFNIFAHVLSKGQGKYPYFKYYYKNIVFLTPGEHALLDQGTEEARISYALDVEERSGGRITADWDRIKKLEEELLEEYHKYFPSTKGMMIGIKYNIQEVHLIVSMLNKVYIEGLKQKH